MGVKAHMDPCFNLIPGWLIVLTPLSLCKIMSNKNKIIEGEIKCCAVSKKRLNMTKS
jgi:hypothetical protein